MLFVTALRAQGVGPTVEGLSSRCSFQGSFKGSVKGSFKGCYKGCCKGCYGVLSGSIGVYEFSVRVWGGTL